MSGSYSSRGDSSYRRRSRSPVRSRESHEQRRYDSRSNNDRSHSRREDRYERHDYRRDDRFIPEEQNEPNIQVVLRNLPDNAREVDIQNQLNSMQACIDDVSLIKDRDTGQSRKFAFVRFTSVGHAIQFVQKHKNFDMDSYRVRVDYCKKNKQDDEKEEWRCAKCGHFNAITRRNCVECKHAFSASSTEIRKNDAEPIEINDGSKDVSTTPNTILLLRQLDHLSTEESIFNAFSILEGVYRTFLIRDKMTKLSCEYAFVEFTEIQYAKLALDYARELLEIDGRRVTVSYAKEECFIPVYGQSEWSFSVQDGLAAYWDKSAYASEYSLAIEEEKQQAKKREEELKKQREEEAKKVPELKDNNLDDDLSAFYAEMGDFEADDNNDIFSVPKPQ